MKAGEPYFDDADLLSFAGRQYDATYIVDPILPAGGIGLIHGKAGHGKSQWMLSLVDAISSGRPFLGRYRTTEAKVLYVQADMPENLFNERVRKAVPHLTAPENVVIAQTRAFDILDPKTQDALADLEARHSPGFITVDTLRKSHTEDENSSMVSAEVYATWKALFPSAAIFFQHHDRKSQIVPKGSKRDDGSSEDQDALMETFRGNRSWVDDADLGVHLYKFATQNKLKMSWSKWRCEPQPTMMLQMNPETLLVEPLGPETAKDWAYALATKGLSTKDWAEAVMTKAKVGRSMAYKVVGEVVAEMGGEAGNG